jgi:hypothetical protein
MKRELTGELAVDVVSLLARCQAVLEKTGVVKEANLVLLLRVFWRSMSCLVPDRQIGVRR